MKKHHWTSYFTYALAIALVMLLGWLMVQPNVSRLAAREMPGAVAASAQLREVADPDAPIGVVREFRLDLLGLTERDCCLAFYTVHQYVEVYIGGELVAQWKPLPDSFIKTVGSNWTFVPLYREDGDREILVRLMPVYEAVREREVTFWVGSELAVYTQRLWMDLPQLIFSGLAILVGLVFLSISVYLLWKRRGGGQLACLGAFALILGLWRINDTRFSPFLLPEKPLLMYYTAIGALMIGVIPLLLSLRKQLPGRWQKALDIYCGGASLLGLCFLAAQVFGGVDLREMLPAIHGVLALGAVGLLVMLFRLKSRASSLPILGALLAVGILADMLCYYYQGNSSGLLYSLLALLVCVVYTGWDLVLTVLRREKELADRRLTSMMSQIRPHFIYNTLGSIEQLCELRPEKAAELVHDFALYLRGNFRELDNPAPIRLSQEIQHTQHYVNIEKVRFPDITVEFQMDSPDFLLPALSIQPLVENAIKHGLMPLPKGGKVLVRSDVQGESYCVTVEDNGVGFDPGTPTDGLGLQNIAGRLEAMCGGRLDVDSAPRKGCRVTLTIPKEGKK